MILCYFSYDTDPKPAILTTNGFETAEVIDTALETRGKGPSLCNPRFQDMRHLSPTRMHKKT
ncbi:MAG: hypothetical protein IPH20_21290 [Bacteroidales bacterium]|nr:hypothetical protein [Bacteroidales bacterium]